MKPRHYNSEDEIRLAEIDRILTNSLGEGSRNCKKTGKLSEQQLKTLKKYKEFYENKPSARGGKIKVATLQKAIRELRDLGLFLKKPFEDATKEDLISYIKYLNKEGIAISSLATLKVDIRSFYKWMHGITKKHEFPEVVDDPLLVPENVRGKKKKADLPTKDDILKLVNAAYNNQHKAMIMILSEGGMRAEELTSANISSLEFDDKGAKFFTEKSKSHERYIRLIHSVPFLHTWLQEHPNKNDPKAPLFVSLRRGGGYTYRRLLPHAISQIIKRLQARVPELKGKRLYCHLLRHYAISQRFAEGMRTETNASRHGISVGTLRDVYLHYDDKDASDEYDELQNIEKTPEDLLKEKEERQKFAPKKCGYCNELNPCTNKYCKACNKPLDVTTFVQEDYKKNNEINNLKSQLDAMNKRYERIEMLLSQDIESIKAAIQIKRANS